MATTIDESDVCNPPPYPLIAVLRSFFPLGPLSVLPSPCLLMRLPGHGETVIVPILSDNYAYLLIDPTTGKAACVDPAEPDKV